MCSSIHQVPISQHHKVLHRLPTMMNAAGWINSYTNHVYNICHTNDCNMLGKSRCVSSICDTLSRRLVVRFLRHIIWWINHVLDYSPNVAVVHSNCRRIFFPIIHRFNFVSDTHCHFHNGKSIWFDFLANKPNL